MKLQEIQYSNWREEIDKKHPYVDVMPGGETEDFYKKANKKPKKEEGVKEDYVMEGNPTARMMNKANTRVTGNLSADRGDSEKDNRSKRKNMEGKLKKRFGGYQKGAGEYKYDSGDTGREVSYQVTKPDKMSKRRFGKLVRRTGREGGQESVITKDKSKPAKLHYTEKGSKSPSDTIGKTKAGKHPQGYGETSGTKVRSGKLPKKTNKPTYHYESTRT